MRLSKRQFECKGSLEFALNKSVFYIEGTGYLMVLKKDISIKRYFEHALRLHLAKHHTSSFALSQEEQKRCAFCNEPNSTHFPKFIVGKDRVVKITGTGYRKDSWYCFTSGNNCPGKLLNPNSIKFVSMTNKMSETEALKHIHSRNKNPFYSENHESKEDYSAAQKKYFYGRSKEKVQEGILKIMSSRQKSFEDHPEKSKKTAFTFISKSARGDLLCSNGERYLYECLEKEGIIDYVSTNGFYAHSIMCYDFYIKDLDQYIEIAGMRGEKYESRIQEKITKFGAIVIKLRSRNFKYQCEELAKQLKDRLNDL